MKIKDICTLFFTLTSDQAILNSPLSSENRGQIWPVCCGFRPLVCSVVLNKPKGAEVRGRINGNKPNFNFLFICNHCCENSRFRGSFVVQMVRVHREITKKHISNQLETDPSYYGSKPQLYKEQSFSYIKLYKIAYITQAYITRDGMDVKMPISLFTSE